MAIVKTETVFKNVKEWFEAETRVYPTHSCIPFTNKFGSGKKVIVLVLGGKK